MAAAVSLAKGANILRQEDLLLDYTIEVEDEQFKVHKVIMASVSDYFKAMLTGRMVEIQTNKVRLEGQSSLAVSAMIEYIYTGQFGSTKVSVKKLLGCAVYLQIPAAIEECTTLLYNKVKKVNCFDILAIFQMYSLEDGIQKVLQYIKSNFKDIISHYLPQKASYTILINLIEVWQESEWNLFLCVEEWVQVDLEKRKHHQTDLMRRIRYAVMPLKELRVLKKMHAYSDVCVRHLVDKAVKYHNLPVHLKVLDASEQSRVRNDPLPTSYVAGSTISPKLLSMSNGGTWKKHKGRRKPDFKCGIHAHLVVNNFLVVCDASDQSWHIFDPRTFKWSTIAPMLRPRSDFALVHCDMNLYALGGLVGPCDDHDHCDESKSATDEIEHFDFKTNTWSVLPNKLPVALHKQNAGVIDGCIYIGGGKVTSESGFSNRLDCFNLSTGIWSRKATMMMPAIVDQTFEVMELFGEKVLYTMGEHLNMQYYSPAADRWALWDWTTCVDTGLIRTTGATMLTHRNIVYLLDALYKYDNDDSSSDYDTDMDSLSDYGIDMGTHRECVKWSLGKKGEKVSEVRLQDFPLRKRIQHYGEENDDKEPTVCSVLLSIPPHI